MRAYSQDLRHRILHAVDQGKPRAEIIRTFEVSRATIKRYLKLRRETGEVRAKAIPGRPSKKGAALHVKANLLLTHFGNLKWTHPHGGERESVVLRSERATPFICSAMAAQSVPSEEPGIKVAPLLFALLTPGSSDGWKNAPIAFSKKTTSCFFAQEE
jgi:hypothetical protein